MYSLNDCTSHDCLKLTLVNFSAYGLRQALSMAKQGEVSSLSVGNLWNLWSS